MSDEALKSLLEARDRKEKIPFENLIYAIGEYASELESALILVDSLKTSLRRSRLSNEDGGIVGGSVSKELEMKLKEMKDERAELYRQQGLQANHLLSLNDQLRQKDSLLAGHQDEIGALKTAKVKYEEELKRLRDQLKERDEGAKIIGDELVALQLELLRLESWQKHRKETPTKNNNNNSKDDTSYMLKSNDESPLLASITRNPLKVVKEKEITAPHQFPLSSSASNSLKRILLTGSEDQKILLYDLTRISTKLVLKWSKINGAIVALAVDGEGRLAASCSAYDQEITLWLLETGKIQSNLPYSDQSSEVPLLQFGAQFRLWMCLDRTIRLWDVQRGLLLRSWSRDHIPHRVIKIFPDSRRPDKLWCIDEKGFFSVLNAVSGKVESVFEQISDRFSGLLVDCAIDQIILAGLDSSNDWILTGYRKNESSTTFDGQFEFNIQKDLSKSTEELKLQAISVHPDRPDLIALISSSILVVKVSRNNWAPETIKITSEGSETDSEGDIDSVHWGPVENDPITGEMGCKLILIGKESKCIKLFSLYGIKEQ